MAVGSKQIWRGMLILKAEDDVLVTNTVEIVVDALDEGQLAFYDHAVVPLDEALTDCYQGVGVINVGAGSQVAAGIHSVINFRRQVGGTHKIDVILTLSSESPRNVHYKVYRKAGLD